jgi:hypothetical protein
LQTVPGTQSEIQSESLFFAIIDDGNQSRLSAVLGLYRPCEVRGATDVLDGINRLLELVVGHITIVVRANAATERDGKFAEPIVSKSKNYWVVADSTDSDVLITPEKPRRAARVGARERLKEQAEQPDDRSRLTPGTELTQEAWANAARLCQLSRFLK